VELSRFVDWILQFVGFESAQGDVIAKAHNFMMAVGVRPEKFKLNLALNLIFAKISGADLD